MGNLFCFPFYLFLGQTQWHSGSTPDSVLKDHFWQCSEYEHRLAVCKANTLLAVLSLSLLQVSDRNRNSFSLAVSKLLGLLQWL